MKAIGHGPAFGLEEVETGRSSDGAMLIRSVRQSPELAAGWNLATRSFQLAGFEMIMSLATAPIRRAPANEL